MTRRFSTGIVLVVFLLLVGTASAYPRAVLFTFDDSRASVYTVGYPIFKNHGYNATFYVVTDEINLEGYQGKTTINLTQLTDLYNAGWDIGDHTRHHDYFVQDNLNLSEQIAEIQGGKDDLIAWGFIRASNHTAFPGGQYDANTTLAMTSAGMLTGRTVESFPLTVPPFNNNLFYLTGVRGLNPNYEAEQYTYLESLSSDNVVIYLTHGVDDPGAGASVTTSTMIDNMLGYMDTHHIPVWTISQLYANISASGPYSPTAHTMTIYPSVDGQVSRQADNSTFADIISGVGTNVADKATTFFGPVIATGTRTQSGKFETSTVGVLSFDTSSIPDDATIELASLVIHQAYLSEDSLGPFTIVITNGTIASGTSLHASDYQTRGDRELTERKPFTHITTGNNTFDFKTDGLTWINKKGSTILFLRRGDDVDGTYAGGPAWARSNQSEHRWDSTEATDSGEHPYLQIDYTIPTPVTLVASLTGTPVSGTAPLSVAFTDQSTGTPDSWNWTFGDGNVTNATKRNPVHTYITPGTYDVSLNVTYAGGVSNVTKKSGYIFVTKYPATKIGVFRNGYWYVDWNGNSTWDVVDAAHTKGPFGQFGDIAVAGDWNGNGTTKIGVFSNGYWYFDWNNNGILDTADALHNGYFGIAGDKPVVGNWTGDGISKIGVFRNGYWYVDWNGNGQWDPAIDLTKGPFGQAKDIAVAGDWNGNGTTKIGVFRSGYWYIDWNNNGIWDAEDAQHIGIFGMAGDNPVIGDWDRMGPSKFGVFRNGSWYVDWNGNGAWDTVDAQHVGYFGANPGDIPIIGDWDGTGPSKFGVFRNGYWYVDWNGNGAWDTVDAQHIGYFGANPGDIPIIGKWS